MSMIYLRPGQTFASVPLQTKPTVTNYAGPESALKELGAYNCPVCEFVAKSKTGLAAHGRSHKEKTFTPNIN